MSAVSIGRNNSIVVSNSLGALNRKLPSQATSVISGVTQVSQTVGTSVSTRTMCDTCCMNTLLLDEVYLNVLLVDCCCPSIAMYIIIMFTIRVLQNNLCLGLWIIQAGGRKMTVQEIQKLQSCSTTVAQFMKQVHASGNTVTGVSQGGSQRTSKHLCFCRFYCNFSIWGQTINLTDSCCVCLVLWQADAKCCKWCEIYFHPMRCILAVIDGKSYLWCFYGM